MCTKPLPREDVDTNAEEAVKVRLGCDRLETRGVRSSGGVIYVLMFKGSLENLRKFI